MSTVNTTTVLSQPAKSSARWLVLIGAVVVQLVLGTVYGYSIFWEPLEAEIFPAVITQAQYDAQVAGGEQVTRTVVVADEQEAEMLRNQHQGYLKYAFSICILSFAVVMVIAGRVQDIKGPRFTATVGAIFMGAGFILAGMMESTIVFFIAHAAFAGAVCIVLLMFYHTLFGSLDQEEYPILKHIPLAIVAAVIVAGVVLGDQYVGKSGEFDKLFLLWGTVGFLAGAGIGFAYVCPLAALIKWFPEHKGLVSGLAVAGFGFGAYLFAGKTWFGALSFIQTQGITPFFLVHGLICLVVISLGATLLRNPPTQEAQARLSSDSRWQETLRRPSFYALWLMYFSGALAGLMVIGIVKVFAGEQLLAGAGGDLDLETTKALMLKGAAAVGWLAIFNAVGRIVWGFVSDCVGRTAAFVAMFSFQAIMMFMLVGVETELTLAIAASIVGFNFGGNFALFPSATADLFGARNLGANHNRELLCRLCPGWVLVRSIGDTGYSPACDTKTETEFGETGPNIGPG